MSDNVCEFELCLLKDTGEIAPDEIVSGPNWMDLTETLYCEAPATVRITGEQDSFGVEYQYYCEGCSEAVYAEIDAQIEADKIGECEWCKKPSTDRREYHAYDDQPWENDLVCYGCRKEDRDRCDEEIAYLDRQLAWLDS